MINEILRYQKTFFHQTFYAEMPFITFPVTSVKHWPSEPGLPADWLQAYIVA
jgi:hypothetical protein